MSSSTFSQRTADVLEVLSFGEIKFKGKERAWTAGILGARCRRLPRKEKRKQSSSRIPSSEEEQVKKNTKNKRGDWRQQVLPDGAMTRPCLHRRREF